MLKAVHDLSLSVKYFLERRSTCLKREWRGSVVWHISATED